MNTLDIVARKIAILTGARPEGCRGHARDLLEAIRDSMCAEMERTLDEREGEYISDHDIDDIDCDCELPGQKDFAQALMTSDIAKALSDDDRHEIAEALDEYFDIHDDDFLKGVQDGLGCECHSPKIDTIRAAFDAAVAP